MDVSNARSTNNSSFSKLEPDADQFLARLIRKKARQVVGRAGFRPGDEADIEQQLHLKVAKHLSAYNGGKGHLYSFLTAIVERNTANIVRDQSAAKRDPRQVVSLSVTVEVKGEGHVELGATISDREANTRLCRTSRCHEQAFDLTQDVDATIAKLPPDEQQVAERLKYDTITEVARDLRIPRSTIYDMLGRWRQTFQAKICMSISDPSRHFEAQPGS